MKALEEARWQRISTLSTQKPEGRSIPAWYPNHVWTVDTTKVLCWGLWPIHVLVAIDHHLRPSPSLFRRCNEFEIWYNTWRPHMTLDGLRPNDLYYSRKPETPNRKAKTVPGNIERHVFAETRLTAYRLKAAA